MVSSYPINQALKREIESKAAEKTSFNSNFSNEMNY